MHIYFICLCLQWSDLFSSVFIDDYALLTAWASEGFLLQETDFSHYKYLQQKVALDELD